MTATETAGRATESQQLWEDREGRPAIMTSERGQGHPGLLLCLGGCSLWLSAKEYSCCPETRRDLDRLQSVLVTPGKGLKGPFPCLLCVAQQGRMSSQDPLLQPGHNPKETHP